MRKLAGKLEDLFIDITFAEERRFKPASDAFQRFQHDIEDTFTSIAFAEAGEFETAARQVNKDGGATGPYCPWNSPKRVNRICTGRA